MKKESIIILSIILSISLLLIFLIALDYKINSTKIDHPKILIEVTTTAPGYIILSNNLNEYVLYLGSFSDWEKDPYQDLYITTTNRYMLIELSWYSYLDTLKEVQETKKVIWKEVK